MAHVLQDVDHLLNDAFEALDDDDLIEANALVKTDFVGLADPGPISPGSLSFLESYFQDVSSRANVKPSRPELKNINNSERSNKKHIQSQNDFPYSNRNLNVSIHDLEDTEYPQWDSPSIQLSVEDSKHKFKRSLDVVESLNSIPYRKRLSPSQIELNSPKRQKGENKEPIEYKSPSAKEILDVILQRNPPKPINEYRPLNAKEILDVILLRNLPNPIDVESPDLLKDLMRMLDEEDDDLRYEMPVGQFDEYDDTLNCDHHEDRSPKRPNSRDDFFTKELENIIDTSEKSLIPTTSYSNIDDLDAIDTSQFDLNTSNFEISNLDSFKNIDEIQENVHYSETLAYVNSTSKVLKLYNLNDDTYESKSKDNTNNDVYILNENESTSLCTQPQKESQSSKNETTIETKNNTNKSGIRIKLRLRTKQKSINLNDEQEFSHRTKRHRKSYDLASIFSKNNWRSISYSEILKIALTYVDKPIPLDWKTMIYPRLIGVCMSIFSKSQISEAWSIMNNNHVNNNLKMNIWNPQIYLDEVSKSYNRYFPIVLQKPMLRLLAFDYMNNFSVNDIIKDSKKEGWTIMPSLHWIRSKIYARIIAANDGLLVLDSVKPAISTIEINYKLVSRENKNHPLNVSHKNQSLLTIINPLTREYLILPPIPFNEYFEKIGYLNISNAIEGNYQLFILGSSTLKNIHNDTNNYKKVYKSLRYIPMVYLAIYNSLKKMWSYFDSFEGTTINFPYFGGRGSCAVINYGLYFGGTRHDPHSDNYEDSEVASIFYINCSTIRLQYLNHPFLLHGIGNIHIPEPPKVLKVANKKIYAVTRELSKNTKKNLNQIVLVEILLNEDGTPNGQYAPVENGIMPEIYLYKLFQKHPSEKYTSIYEVYSSGDLIAFRACYPLFVLYDVCRTNWRLTYYEEDLNIGQRKNFITVEGIYEPNWLAIT